METRIIRLQLSEEKIASNHIAANCSPQEFQLEKLENSNSGKDSIKKKRGGKLAKLKQVKSDVRKEQFLAKAWGKKLSIHPQDDQAHLSFCVDSSSENEFVSGEFPERRSQPGPPSLVRGSCLLSDSYAVHDRVSCHGKQTKLKTKGRSKASTLIALDLLDVDSDDSGKKSLSAGLCSSLFSDSSGRKTRSDSSSITSCNSMDKGDDGSAGTDVAEEEEEEEEEDWETRADSFHLPVRDAKHVLEFHCSSKEERKSAAGSIFTQYYCSNVSSSQMLNSISSFVLKPDRRPGQQQGTRRQAHERRGNQARAWTPEDECRPQSLPPLVMKTSQLESLLSSLPRENDWPQEQSVEGNEAKLVRVESFGNRAVSEQEYSWDDSSQSDDIPSQCLICTEDLDMTDASFMPCDCGFRLCLFCHHRILYEDGRCPGCRKTYSAC